MKKIVSIILALTLLVSLAACGESGAESSAGETSFVNKSGQESAEGSAEASEESKEEFVVNPKVELINSMLDGEIDRTQKAKNLFDGLTYTLSAVPSAEYADPDLKKLTDGKMPEVFNKQDFVAWTNTSVSAVFDLGEGEHVLADVVVKTLRQVNYGIGLPGYVTVFASNDGEEYVDLGKCEVSGSLNDSMCYDYCFAFPKGVKARYIKIFIAGSDRAFTFVSEILGYEYCADGDIDRNPGAVNDDPEYYYDFYNYSLDTTDYGYWKNTGDADYDDVINLALLDETTVHVSHFDPISKTSVNQGPASDIEKLIDGKYHAKEHYSDASWVHFTRGGGRHVVIDLKYKMAVTGFKATFLNMKGSGVAAPPAAYVALSNDGENWVTVSAEESRAFYEDKPVIWTYEAELKDTYEARFVRITFETVPFNVMGSSVYMDEFEVYGKKNASGAKKAEYDKEIVMGRYPELADIGAENILFASLTNGYGVHCTENCTIDEDSALRYLAYVDKDGSVTDTFMDSVSLCFRGGTTDCSEKRDAYNFFLDEMFYEGLNLDALNKVKGEINEKLGKNEKVGIWLAVICPRSGYVFDGKKITKSEEAVAFLKWQADECVRRFAEKGYENLEFLGFYWASEHIDEENIRFDVASITGFNEYVHSLGLLSSWCPYYGAYGKWRWREVGFDYACLQPNAMFYETDRTRLRTTAEMAKIYGMCVEIELEDYTSESTREIYRNYLRTSCDAGHINSIKVYYQGSVPGAFEGSCNAQNDDDRSVYEDTYNYAKNKLDDSYGMPKGFDLSAFSDTTAEVENGKRVTLGIPSLEGVSCRILTSPVYGSFKITTSGKIVYSSLKGYCGEDTLVIMLYDGVNEPKTVKYTFTVTE